MPVRHAPPAFVPLLLPSLVEEPPAGGFLHEIKHDGFRTSLTIGGGRVRAFTRRGHDWSGRYGRIVEAAAALPCRSALIDGEAIVQAPDGRSSLEALQNAIYYEPHRIVYYAFDLLRLDGENLCGRPLEERKARLADLIGMVEPTAAIHLCEAIAGDGAKIFAAAEAMGLEGIVSKRAGSRYASGRSRVWLKTKAMTEGEFVVVGMEPNPGAAPLALLARDTEEGLVYAGSAFVTLRAPHRDAFWIRTEALKVPKPVCPELRRTKASYVRPELRVRARHLRGEGMLRHASLQAIIG
jgi:ATP-dependent DNA ligase